MVSLGAKVVDGAPTFMSAPMVLPRSTAVTEAELAGAGAGSGIGAGTGSVVAGGVVIAASSWSFLQPASASVPSRAAAIAILRVLRVMERSEEHTSELQSLMRISYAVLCSQQKNCTRARQRTRP